MEHTVNFRRVHALVAASVVAAAALVSAAPAHAQGRHQVLVPNFESTVPVRGNFGRDVSREIQRSLGQTGTHIGVESRELQQQLNRFQLREQDLDCGTALQLSMRAGWDLVMCGEFEPAAAGGMTVTARVIVPETQDAFDIPAFQANNPREAAAHIVQEFQTFTRMLVLAQTCFDYLEMQNWDEALQSCEQALEVSPTAQSPLYGRAHALMHLERNEEALAAFQTLLQANPLNQDAILSSGIISSRLGRSDEAMGFFRQYLEMNPGNIQVRLAVANDVFRAGDPRSALMIMEEVAEAADADITAVEYAGHFALSTAQALSEGQPANGTTAEARPYFERALQYYNRVYAAQGEETEAVTIRQMLAVYTALGRTDEAIEFGRRATRTHGDDAQLWSNLATALERAGRSDDALQALRQVERLDPDWDRLHARRGQLLLQAGRLNDAQAAFRQAIQRGLEPDAIGRSITATGWTQFGQRDQHQRAIEFYNVAREFATTEQTRAMTNFFHGFALYRLAERAAAPQTVASARQSLPMFQEVQRLLQGARAYTEQISTINNILQATGQHIDIQEALIRRGR